MGLGQVRELTRKTIAAILGARKVRPFSSLDDLLRRARPRLAEAENLIRAGALDGLGPGRKAVLAELKGRPTGSPLQLALPLAWTEEPTEEDFTLAERLVQELAMLGWPVSAHPLAPHARELAVSGVLPCEALAGRTGERVAVAGVRLSLWGERRGRIEFEDETGLFTVRLPGGRRLPPGTLGKLGPYYVQGRVQSDRGPEVTILAERVNPL
jgi:DNA polymerase III alpha subunit